MRIKIATLLTEYCRGVGIIKMGGVEKFEK